MADLSDDRQRCSFRDRFVGWVLYGDIMSTEFVGRNSLLNTRFATNTRFTRCNWNSSLYKCKHDWQALRFRKSLCFRTRLLDMSIDAPKKYKQAVWIVKKLLLHSELYQLYRVSQYWWCNLEGVIVYEKISRIYEIYFFYLRLCFRENRTMTCKTALDTNHCIHLCRNVHIK